MVTEKDVEHIAGLADIGIGKDELDAFTRQFNEILDYFDILDRVKGGGAAFCDQFNIMREDEVTPSLPQEAVLHNAAASEEGFIKAPRVM
jgi:aspartyl-tRNA(Asn)/glutamyl-tRNA(Gln) amidotransferase subunit C